MVILQYTVIFGTASYLAKHASEYSEDQGATCHVLFLTSIILLPCLYCFMGWFSWSHVRTRSSEVVNFLIMVLWTVLWTLILAKPALNADPMTIYTFGANLLACEILVTLMVCFSKERFDNLFCYVIVTVIIFILASAVTACIVFDFNGVFGPIFIAFVVYFYMSLKLVVLLMMHNSIALDND